jgi:hypothetical protein
MKRDSWFAAWVQRCCRCRDGYQCKFCAYWLTPAKSPGTGRRQRRKRGMWAP